jgi:hypothetical protein
MNGIRSKRVRMASTLFALSMGTAGLAAGLAQNPADAATVAQKCATVKGSATITPGLTNTPANQTVKVNTNATSCTPSTATGGSGKMTATINLTNVSCASLATAQTLSGTGKIVWKNTKVSKIRLTAKTTSSDPTLATVTGKVTSGLFSGKNLGGKIRFTPVFSGTGPACSATNPLKKVTISNQINSSTKVPFRIFTP